MNNTTIKSPPLLIAITGSIGSGKSQAAAIFERLGASIIDADKLAREVVLPDTPAFSEIISLFGSEVITGEGTLNRKRLAEVVFSDPDKRILLEKIVHPRVQMLFRERLSDILKRDHAPKLIIYVIPLLFESNVKYNEFDAIVVVNAPRELSIKRIIQRDGCTKEMAELRYNTQISIEEKVARADYVINNDGSLINLEDQVGKLYKLLIEKG